MYSHSIAATAMQEQVALSKNQTIAVIGAGPKALAIAAKRYVLKQLGFSVPDLVIVEKQEVGANWCGKHGFTDGRQPLGTSATKGIDFPWNSECWGDFNGLVNKAIAEFSWQQYVIDKRDGDSWVDSGQPAPSHKEWSDYQKWVAAKVDFDLQIAEVNRIDISNNRWLINCRAKTGQLFTLETDGVIVTGHGKPKVLPGSPENHPRVLNSQSAWLKLPWLKDTNQKSIAIVGSRETAGSIAAALAGCDQIQVDIITPQGIRYTRGESFTENRWFSNPCGWKNLPEESRRDFIRRTDRGVISNYAQAIIDRAGNVSTKAGRVVRVEPEDDRVCLRIENLGKEELSSYDYLITAIGFNPFWFEELLTDNVKRQLCNAVGSNFNLETVERLIDDDLSITDFKPRLHLPMVAGLAQGPGFPNLSCLGLLSDRILSAYAIPSEKLALNHLSNRCDATKTLESIYL